ncbi:RNA ligase 1 family protein [Erythrobacter mangrovi]|uniref:Uncharacterized protein n=1 Tax=Erythrobacter mangrovi TaxID=2739433 RepID=A0A7D4BMH9_9SPHN|nr:DUF5565 family protein [Erythrobacter mangrovi]QKG70224.1 hypothetical protein HQR01_01900 [Erythrobacter mangrovi]
MKKIPTVFVMDRTSRPHAITRECREKWVLAGEGVATIKFDGTACLVRGGKLYQRYNLKLGRSKPHGFIAAADAPDPVTGHFPGWVPVREDDPGSQYHLEAFTGNEPDGTYELLGPKIQGGRYEFERHVLLPHGSHPVKVERNFDALKDWLVAHPEHEGLVFHHPDGRMAKLRRRDFGLRW